LDWKATPAGISSEEAVLTAIATGTAPDLYSNTFIGFAETLAKSRAAVPLEEFPGFEDVIKSRKMANIMGNYQSRDGHIYLLPWYANAVMWAYGAELLKEAGLEKPPRTYGELLALAPKVVIPKKRWLAYLSPEAKWWHIWWTYMHLYYAAGEGRPFVEKNQATFVNEAGVASAKFAAELFAKEFAPLMPISDPVPKGKVLTGFMGPFWVRPWKQNYPEFEYLVTAPPVPDGYPVDKPIYTLADAKGIVMLAQAKPEAREAAWEFMQWLYTTPENDLIWLELDGEPSAREDLLTNPFFQDFFRANPKVRQFAEEVAFAVPPPPHPEIVEIQTTFMKEAWQPLIYGKKTPEQALKDAKEAIDGLIAPR
ncbi:MAG: extracellular solute-binding protein, partial [Candidatus Hydrothermarchaeales archaeon]